MQEINNPQYIKNAQNAMLPAAEATKKKTINKMKEYQNITVVADSFIEKLPKMQEFVNNKLAVIKNNVACGSNIADGGIGDWVSADESLKAAANKQRGLEFLNSKAKKVLFELVKRTEKLGILPKDRAYFEGEKICYLADKEFAELVRALTTMAEKERWLKRKGLKVNATDEGSAAGINRS